ncbi:hypothetical protein RN01_03100 [Cupriavidus sp. SHE]|jgi:hypothetical protein|uniref:Uncharacterized protein n=1 Tax=Cupriavidus metallidurans TaxID=119219 RepID=A0A482IYN9_9BURK|nr:hypothetical protein RN01_03100 [Cupriavidus sp. SHE]QBP12064.1 hypothetical protein DDF84_020000 [Cupriavidus metallidurans]
MGVRGGRIGCLPLAAHAWTAGGGGGQTTRLNYQMAEQVTGPWSGSVGASWTINRSVGLLLEIGYGYNRNYVIATGLLRF